jgi:hypothetical protein
MSKLADEDEIVAALLAAEFKLCAMLRLLRQRVPEQYWGAIIARAATLLAENQDQRALLDQARAKMDSPPG